MQLAPTLGERAWIRWIPRGYLLEVLVAGVLIVLALRPKDSPSRRRIDLVWACCGVLAGVAVLGAATIGAGLIPGIVLVLVAASLATARSGANFFRAAIWCLLGFAAQAALVLLVIAIVVAASPAP